MTDRDIIELLKTRLDDYRLNHSLAVAEQAEHLAKRYHCDTAKAKTAGLLHDVMKNESSEAMLTFIQEHQVELSDVEKNSPKLWHSILGAVFVKEVIGITDEDILRSIRYHTTARANMSLLEKIIYLADYTSSDRSYPGVEEMRKTVEMSLEEAMKIALTFTIRDLVSKQAAVHPDTIAAYNEILLQCK